MRSDTTHICRRRRQTKKNGDFFPLVKKRRPDSGAPLGETPTGGAAHAITDRRTRRTQEQRPHTVERDYIEKTHGGRPNLDFSKLD